MKTFLDDRGFSIHNIFPELNQGQINWSTLQPGIIKAFHRHKKQTDYWACLIGNAKVILVDENNDIEVFYIGEQNPQLITIPPGIWHGYTPIGNQPCGLLYYVTEKYTGEDEERLNWDYFGREIWEVEFK